MASAHNPSMPVAALAQQTDDAPSRVAVAEPKAVRPFTTLGGKSFGVSDSARQKAAAMMAAHKSKPAPAPASTLLEEEVANVRKDLASSMSHLADLSNSKLQNGGLHINFHDLEHEKTGDELSADERREWATRFKALLTPLEEAATTLPSLSVRVAFAERGLANRRREVAEQLQADLCWIKACVLRLETTAVPPSGSEPSGPTEEEDELADSLMNIGSLS